MLFFDTPYFECKWNFLLLLIIEERFRTKTLFIFSRRRPFRISDIMQYRSDNIAPQICINITAEGKMLKSRSWKQSKTKKIILWNWAIKLDEAHFPNSAPKAFYSSKIRTRITSREKSLVVFIHIKTRKWMWYIKYICSWKRLFFRKGRFSPSSFFLRG